MRGKLGFDMRNGLYYLSVSADLVFSENCDWYLVVYMVPESDF